MVLPWTEVGRCEERIDLRKSSKTSVLDKLSFTYLRKHSSAAVSPIQYTVQFDKDTKIKVNSNLYILVTMGLDMIL